MMNGGGTGDFHYHGDEQEKEEEASGGVVGEEDEMEMEDEDERMMMMMDNDGSEEGGAAHCCSTSEADRDNNSVNINTSAAGATRTVAPGGGGVTGRGEGFPFLQQQHQHIKRKYLTSTPGTKDNLRWLNHQIRQLMSAFNVPFCKCGDCLATGLGGHGKVSSKLGNLSSASMDGFNSHHHHKSTPLNGTGTLNNSTSFHAADVHDFHHLDSSSASAGLVADLNAQFGVGGGGDGCGELYAQRRGRRSKYCTPNERKLVARYAQMYGASAAARKFSIPPAVAAYYHRKECRNGMRPSTEGISPSQQMDGAGGGDSGGYGSPSAKMVEPDLNIPPISEYLAALQDKKQQQKQQQANGGDSALQQNQQQKHNNIDHQNGGEQLFGQNGEMLDGNNHQSSHHKQQQQHLLMSQLKTEGLDESGWPNGAPPPPNAVGGGMSQQQAFLRGRGRGRPKLIGDELDAELVEWMVMLKQSNPGRHINASQALGLARSYIMEKSPGLLAENGGQVKLRITWAMKLLNRVSEREREIQLGLPPGTLQNMTRGSNTSTSNGGNNNGGVGGGGASRSAGASALDELQQLFGQVSSYNQQQAGGNGSQNSIFEQSSDGGDGSAEQFLSDLTANGLSGLDSEILQKILGNLQQQQGHGGPGDFPSTSAAAGTSSGGGNSATTAQEFLVQTTGAF